VQERAGDFVLVRTWPGGRHLERAFHDAQNSVRWCPDCCPVPRMSLPNVTPRHVRRARRVELPAVVVPARPHRTLAERAERGAQAAERFLADRAGWPTDRIEQAAARLTAPYWSGGRRTPEGDAEQSAFAETITAALAALRTSRPALAGALVTAPVRRWPLFLIAAPAAVAVWSGWVGLGTLCGFGVIHPLPGIWDGLRLNTAITLPVGVEAYGAYALGAWLTPGTSDTARAFARGSAIGALTLGMLGQVVYHLLAAAHADRAPWPVVVFVSCLPVVALGFGAALAHLLRTSEGVPEAEAILVPRDRGVPVPALASVPAPRTQQPDRGRTRATGADRARAQAQVDAALAAGKVPGVRPLKTALGVGQAEAQAERERLRGELEAQAVNQ
jgi:hypothetical protein